MKEIPKRLEDYLWGADGGKAKEHFLNTYAFKNWGEGHMA